MSTVVYQGLQSCLDSTHLLETTTLRLKLVSPKSIGMVNTKEVTEKCHYDGIHKTAIPIGDDHLSSNHDLGGWSFLQSLPNSSQTPREEMENQTSYVHPLFKQSSSLKLSEKSLELCTESLGSETGSDTSETTIFSVSSWDPTSGKSSTREKHNSLHQMESRVGKNSHNFPPPLTTISGSNSLQVRPHREDGRLIIKAVEAPPLHTYFQAERSHGRLRLSFLKNCEPNCDPKVNMEENEEDGHEEEYEEEEDEEENDVWMNEKDMDGNSYDVDVEMGMEKFERPRGCKESGHCNKGLCSWGSFWVATTS